MKQHAVAVESVPEWHFPVGHWEVLHRFVEGDERDAHDLFGLADDTWEGWPYAGADRAHEAHRFRFRFGQLRSFLRPYAKSYCYDLLLGQSPLRAGLAQLPDRLALVDRQLVMRGIPGIDGLVDPEAFRALWDAMIAPGSTDHVSAGGDHVGGVRTRRSVWRQEATRSFWLALRRSFGVPTIVPPVAPHLRATPNSAANDTSRVVPGVVLRQIVNRIALHRDGRSPLNRYDLLRGCVLVLLCCLGRRINEVLAAPRGRGQNGPLHRYPSADGSDALWFSYRPNKRGPDDAAYISPEWEEIAQFAVSTLVQLGDEVRAVAEPAVADRLILVSGLNWTAGPTAAPMDPARQPDRFDLVSFDRRSREEVRRRAIPLSANAFMLWLNAGSRGGGGSAGGAMARWGITVDGSKAGPIYYFRAHNARHTRQTALARDPKLSRLTAQRDLNHRSRDMQTAYQHALSDQNERLVAAARSGKLLGPGVEWIRAVHTGFAAGAPTLLSDSPRWRALVANNANFVALNRVPMGYCSLPQGPASCEEFLMCAEASPGGCRWFVIDPANEEALAELAMAADTRRAEAEELRHRGHVVAAGRVGEGASRTEELRDAALGQAAADVRERVRAAVIRLREREDA